MSHFYLFIQIQKMPDFLTALSSFHEKEKEKAHIEMQVKKKKQCGQQRAVWEAEQMQ